MRANLSDTQIRASLRSVLTRHRCDLNKTSFFCARGVVRMLGELQRHGTQSTQPIDLGEVEAIESDIQSVKGVVRVHFDLSNVRKLSNGQWQAIEKKKSLHTKSVHEESEPLTDW